MSENRVLVKPLPLVGPIDSADSLHDYISDIIIREVEVYANTTPFLYASTTPFLVQVYVTYDVCQEFMLGKYQNQVCPGDHPFSVTWVAQVTGVMRAEIYVVSFLDQLEKG